MKNNKIYLIMIALLLVMPMASAMEWDNIEEFDKSVGNYGKYEVYNSWLIPNVLKGEKLVDIKLDENTGSCGINCHSDVTEYIYDKGKLYDGIIFRNGSGDIVEREYNTILKNVPYEKEINDYGECNDDRIIHDNKTGEDSVEFFTYPCVIGKHNETFYRDELYEDQDLENGNYEWRLNVKKKINEDLDWVIIVRGVESTEWAWYNSSYLNYVRLNITEPGIIDRNISGDGSGLGWLVNTSITFPEQRIIAKREVIIVDSTNSTELEFGFKNITAVGNNITEAEISFRLNEAVAKSGSTHVYVYYDCDACGNHSFTYNYDNSMLINETGTALEFANYSNFSAMDGGVAGIASNPTDGGNPGRGYKIVTLDADYGHSVLYKSFTPTNPSFIFKYDRNMSIVSGPANNVGALIINGTEDATSLTYTTDGICSRISGFSGQLLQCTESASGDVTWESTSHSRANITNFQNNITIMLVQMDYSDAGGTTVQGHFDNILIREFFDGTTAQGSEQTEFAPDTTPPNVSIVYPTNVSYGINVTALNYNHGDANPGDCWNSVDGGTTNSSAVTAGVNFTGLISSIGSNNWTVYCNDTSNNLNTSSITFEKFDPTNITTCTQLQGMNNGLNINYTLGSNVDCSDTVNWNSGEGFLPVGNSTSGFEFIGILQGNNYNITDLFINRPSEEGVGLFSNTSSVEINNVGLVNINITGNDSVGGLIGFSILSIISNSYVIGYIQGGEDDVGGLIGDGGDSIINNSYVIINISGDSSTGGLIGSGGGANISNSYSTGIVNGSEGSSSSIGGLLGLGSGSYITNSYSTADIFSDSQDVGGLVGHGNGGDIINSYSTGNVKSITGSGDEVGGLVGQGDGVNISNSYSTGNVSGDTEVGGLVGSNDTTTTITNSYYNNHSGNPSVCAGEGVFAGCSAIDDDVTYFQGDVYPATHPFSNWSFFDIWEERVGDYPSLTWQGLGEDISPIIINITFPLNTSYAVNISELNYTYTFSNDSCWYSLDGGATNSSEVSTGTNFTNVISTEGSNNWTVYCNDTSGDEGSNNVVFFKDTIPPFISITTPTNNTNSTNNLLDVNFTRSNGGGLGSCWYSNDTYIVNRSLGIGSACNNITNITWSEGQHNVTVWVNDTVGNINFSSVTFSIDTVSPTIDITYPTNISYVINVSVINYTYSDANPSDCWNSVDGGATNSSSVTAGVNFTGLISSEGSNNWTVYCNDTSNNLNTSSVVFFKDTIPPTITSIWNITNITTTTLPVNSTWNFSVSDVSLDSCWYYTSDDSTNVSVTCNQSTINTTSWATEGSKTITACVNDSFGSEQCNSSSLEVFFYSVNFQHSPDFIGELGSIFFELWVNQTNINTTTANIYFNNTYYTPDSSDNSAQNFSYFNYTFVAPDGFGNSTGNEFEYLWNFTIEGIITNENTSSDNFTVFSIEIDNCTSFETLLLNFSLYDEETAELINGSLGSTIEIDLTLSVGDQEWTYSEINNGSFEVCHAIPDGVINNTNYTVDYVVGFSSTDRVHEFFYLDNGTLVNGEDMLNSLTNRTLGLYDLATADSTSFLFNFFDEDGLPVENSIVHVFRKYVGEGIFREVERAKQDENGDTTVHLVEEDVIYFFAISLNGKVLFTSSTYTALCQALPCTIQLEASGDFQQFDDEDIWDLVANGSYSLVMSSLTRQVNLTYLFDDSATANLTIYEYDSDGEYSSVTSGIDTGLSGEISLTVPMSVGNKSFFASIYKDNSFIRSVWVDLEQDAGFYFGNTLALFLGFLIILCFALMAASEGGGTIIWALAGMLITSALGLVDYRTPLGVNLLIYFICVGGIILWKLAKKTR